MEQTGFNSLQVESKVYSEAFKKVNEIEFQFLIGRVKRVTVVAMAVGGFFGFNSLQVESKGISIIRRKKQEKKFQFLIGRVKSIL